MSGKDLEKKFSSDPHAPWSSFPRHPIDSMTTPQITIGKTQVMCRPLSIHKRINCAGRYLRRCDRQNSKHEIRNPKQAQNFNFQMS
jgi:hypothetical protein